MKAFIDWSLQGMAMMPGEQERAACLLEMQLEIFSPSQVLATVWRLSSALPRHLRSHRSDDARGFHALGFISEQIDVFLTATEKH